MDTPNQMRCVAPGCEQEKLRAKDLCCPECWALVPTRIKREFWAADKAGNNKAITRIAVRILAGVAAVRAAFVQKKQPAPEPITTTPERYTKEKVR